MQPTAEPRQTRLHRWKRHATHGWLCLLALIVCPAIALAEDNPVAKITPSDRNLGRLRWIQYHMVAGRIVASSQFPGTNLTIGPVQVDARRRERLEIRIDAEAIRVRYELAQAHDQLVMSVDHDNHFSLLHNRAQPAYAMRFEQQPGKGIVLELTDGGMRRQWHADSFWHLYLASPAEVSRHLVPLLEQLHPAWQLTETGEAIERALVERGQAARPSDHRKWAHYVERLASPQFTERQAAQRESPCRRPGGAAVSRASRPGGARRRTSIAHPLADRVALGR